MNLPDKCQACFGFICFCFAIHKLKVQITPEHSECARDEFDLDEEILGHASSMGDRVVRAPGRERRCITPGYRFGFSMMVRHTAADGGAAGSGPLLCAPVRRVVGSLEG